MENKGNTSKFVEGLGLSPRIWGIWETLSFSLVISFLFIATQTVFCVIFALTEMFQYGKHSQPEIRLIIKKLEANGLFLSISTCSCALLCISAISFFIFVRKGVTFSEYLGLHRIGVKESLKWFFSLLLFIFCMDVLNFLIGIPVVPEFMEKIYVTAYFTPLLFFALIVAAPLFEELFFRGFLFVGIWNSRFGYLGAAIITSTLWAAIHMQYDFYGIIQIFLTGLLLSYARVRSGSLYPCIIMHSLMNLVATIEVAVKLKMH